MEFQIRRACADDIPHIVALQDCSLRQLSVGSYSAAQIELLVRTQGDARVRSFESGHEIIYVASAKVSSTQRDLWMVAIAAFVPWQSKISGLYVHPDFVRQGIATRLLQAVEAEAMSQGRTVLRVMSSLVGVPFYEAAGFRRLFSRTIHFAGESVDCVEMAKSLVSNNLFLEISKQFARQFAVVVGPLVVSVALVWFIALLI